MGIWNLLKLGSKKPPEPIEEAPPEPEEHRVTDRESTYRDSRIFYHAGDSDPCIINDVSATGIRVSCQRARSFPEQVRIMWGGEKRLCNVVWVDGIVAGLEFVQRRPADDIPQEELEDAQM
ncbi:hypothetical protein [Hirschia litorea]|uniref:PilZ domain-containing protein n=1 Tax=Hirschia litorea TaxID=1199156 RepID=A0ABW2IL67_9PROT